MTPQHEMLILDNPNLTAATLSRFTGLSRNRVERFRTKRQAKANWVYRGYGIPFMAVVDTTDCLCFRVYKGRKLFVGRFHKAIEMVDRLIFCLENNHGKLPPTMNEYVFDNLKFGEVR